MCNMFVSTLPTLRMSRMADLQLRKPCGRCSFSSSVRTPPISEFDRHRILTGTNFYGAILYSMSPDLNDVFWPTIDGGKLGYRFPMWASSGGGGGLY